MEDFSWGGIEATECSSPWTDSTLVHRSSIFSPALYNGIDPIPRQIELQRAQTSLIENFNSARWARGDSHVHCSGLISPMSLSANPVSSGCMNLQSVVTPVAAGQANDGLNIIESSSKDSLNMLDCLLSETNSSNGFVGEDGATSSPPILQNTHSRSCWKYGTSQTVSSGDLENDNASLPGSKAKVNEGINKRKSNVREGGLRLMSEVDPTRSKRVRSGKNRGQNHNLKPSAPSNICFQLYPSSSFPTSCIDQEPDHEAIAQMKEMIYRAAAFRPVNLGVEMVEKPKRKNVRVSSDPLTMAARQRRERISERIRVLQRLVPGGTKMDTASMLEEAANYLKFLQSQIKALENLDPKLDGSSTSCYPINNLLFSSLSFNNTLNPMQAHPFPLQNPYQSAHSQS